MEKRPFVTNEQIQEIVKKYPTPFHLYDEKGIRENAKAVKRSLFLEQRIPGVFRGKGNPQPVSGQIFCGSMAAACDCSSLTELMLSKGHRSKRRRYHVLFQRYSGGGIHILANELSAIINLDDITHIEFLEECHWKCCRKR